MSELNETNFRHLCKDVKEIKNALIGSDVFGQKGIIKRLEEVETESDKQKAFRQKILYYAAGAAGTGAGTIQLLFNVL